MKFGERQTAGRAGISASKARPTLLFLLFATTGLLAGAVYSQALYKYRGDDGEWIYSDRAPQTDSSFEVRDLPKGMSKPAVNIFDESLNGNFYISRATSSMHRFRLSWGWIGWITLITRPPKSSCAGSCRHAARRSC